jgi:hypothetical protein
MVRLFALALFVVAVLPAQGQIFEDFESYSDTPGLQVVWSFAQLDTTTPNPGTGTKSLKRGGEATYLSGYYSAASGDGSEDLSDEDIGVLARRDPGSVSPTGLQLEIRDGSSLSCFSPVVEVTDTSWHAVDVDPQGSNCQSSGIDVTDISVVRLWVFNRMNVGGSFDIAANFDDLAIFLARDGFESGDLSGWSSFVGGS